MSSVSVAVPPYRESSDRRELASGGLEAKQNRARERQTNTKGYRRCWSRSAGGIFVAIVFFFSLFFGGA